MEEHSHAAHEAGAAEDTHGHYASEIDGGATEDDVHWARREIGSLRDSVRDLQVKYQELQAKFEAERALVDEVRQGAVTVSQLAIALRARAMSLARPGALARGQHPHDFDKEMFLQMQLCLLANEIEGPICDASTPT